MSKLTELSTLTEIDANADLLHIYDASANEDKKTTTSALLSGISGTVTTLSGKVTTLETNDTNKETRLQSVESVIPTEATSSNKLADKSYVSEAIADAVGDITSFDISIVNELPETGVKGTLYFVPNSSGETGNTYNEYIWIPSASKFELIGSKNIDLSNYMTLNTAQTVTGAKTFTGEANFTSANLNSSPIVNKSMFEFDEDTGTLNIYMV